MPRQRLIGVVTVRQGVAVQSFGYQRWLPLGRPETLIHNLDRWGADEILLCCIDRSGARLDPDLELLGRIGGLNLATPLIYAGGIRSTDDAVAVLETAAKRVAIDALLHDDLGEARRIAERIGSDKLIAALPLSFDRRRLMWYDHRRRSADRLPQDVLGFLRERVATEALLIDWQHEGRPGAFDMRIAERFSEERLPFIAFGGVGDANLMRRVLRLKHNVAIAVGNTLSWRAHAVEAARRELGEADLEPPAFVSTLAGLCHD